MLSASIGNADYEFDDGGAGRNAVNDVSVYDEYSIASYFGLEAAPIDNILRGLQILKVDVNESYKIATHPLESGQITADTKIKNPTTITITAMCDNLRGGIDTVEKEQRSFIQDIKNIGQGLKETLWSGKEYNRTQSILSLARNVYAKLHRMLTEREFKTYIVATKGAVYTNMMITGITQLNEPEHLLTIPVTIKFEEILSSNQSNVIAADDSDVEIVMQGSAKEKGLLPAIGERIGNAVSGVGDYFIGG